MPDLTAREKDLFNEALEIRSPEARASFLAGACGSDAALRQRLEELLAAYFSADGFLPTKEVDPKTLESDTDSEPPGTVIGRYKLLQKVGEGGFGVVYMAEQEKPMKRRVALKIIKLGMDTKQVVARFEAERQALALMDHPNIAKVLDAGATETGRPYFVMELVKGIPITLYCDQEKLDTRKRLNLFVKVCQGVQHAHQKGIIHRDLKPSNVLAAEYDHHIVPKIIDFGVAKALDQPLTDRTMFTRFGEVVGTLDYMSPEQAKLNQLDIDTRSDVYALGVLLYELLAGSTPIDKRRLQSSCLDEILRIIREEDPPKPSTRLCSSAALPALASQRNTEPQKLPRTIRGDLDWIVMKAMAKERNQRYQTAEALATDIERHLHDLPIQARRPSFSGRVRRFVRRNKVPVALATLAVLACGVAMTSGLLAYLGGLERREQALVIQQAQAREEQERWARLTAMPAIKQLVEDGRLVHAFRLAKEVQAVLPNDPAFQELWESFTVTVSFDLKPAGAKVYIRDWNGVNDEWLEVGEAPLTDVTLPKEGLRFRYVREGYITREFDRPFPDFLGWDGPVAMKEDPGIPNDMVFVDGVVAASWNNLPSDLGDFLIDRYEVSNREYQEFVNAGGYEKPNYWEDLHFTREGRTLSWTEAMAQFSDATGQAGPAGWRNGRFPEREEDYPVQGVSWFEAVAYARFAEKSLPTIYHWQWAADGTAGHITALSNFSRRGPAPKGTYQGIGRFDVYDLAGNVKEWCWNLDPEGHRCLRGGAWNEASYQFLFVDVASPWDRLETHGFRCMRLLGDGTLPPATVEPWRRKLPHLADQERLPINSLEPWYQCDKGQPLHPKSIQTEYHPPEEYRHEVVQIDAAYNDEHFDVHLFYPHAKRERYETILFVPGAGAWLSQRFGPAGIVEWELIPRLTQTGRAVCLPVCKGMFERGDGRFPVPQRAVQLRAQIVAAVKDIARTVDYLRSRGDIDSSRLVFLGYSAGATLSLPALCFHEGLQAAILISAAYPPQAANAAAQVTHPYQFTTHVKLPVLMINGGLDTLFPYQTLQAPMFEDLGSEDKKHVLLECGHNPPNEDIVEIVDEWLRGLLSSP